MKEIKFKKIRINVPYPTVKTMILDTQNNIILKLAT